MYSSGRPQRAARVQAPVDYHEDDASEFDGSEDSEDDRPAFQRSKKSSRKVKRDPDENDQFVPVESTTRSGRQTRKPSRLYDEGNSDHKAATASPGEENSRRVSGRIRNSRMIHDSDDAEGEAVATGSLPPRNAFPARPTRQSGGSASAAPYANGHPTPASKAERKLKSKARHSSADAESFKLDDSETASDEAEESDDPIALNSHDEDESPEESLPVRRTRSQATRNTRNPRSSNRRVSEDFVVPARRLRARTSRPNYQIPPLDISAELNNIPTSSAQPSGRAGTAGRFGVGSRFGGFSSKGIPWAMQGRDLARAMGDPDTSDSDDFLSPMKNPSGGTGIANTGAGKVGAPIGAPTDVPNFGRINPKSTLADADPLGVDMNVTFDNVGGLDDHINQLKEMVALPLLYPEMFQHFGITPPRGVLFHGPPGTGKTLLARALAASCSTGNTKIAFFMRKGADVLSKWVGEAERQLRMLFEEARAAQPSIIFFDEIDGLAPVRSSKQDQIHASLVSTLLALMDGMDGRGQVIVIGATNRPDAVDSALRRPGRFDREFYFPLPNKDARKKIIGINTRKWEPPLSDELLDHLAAMTKGYGGADLRALCTEAALNAIQRRYPQIYKTPDRLQLDTASVSVKPKDFMLSIKRIVPSSARSSSSAAVQLPKHLLPLLAGPLEQLKTVVDLALPPKKSTTALEEAEYEDDDDSFEKHAMLQALDKLRTYRPRILLYGEHGMGQNALGPAILHHLEGFFVQSFDLGSLMGDATRSVEAAIVQTFVEAKRHQPSIIYIPAFIQWISALSDVARSTVKAMLDSMSSSDPIVILAVLEGSLDLLPRDVREWFGHSGENRVNILPPSDAHRRAFFAELIKMMRTPPNDFPDALPRRKRVLEELPLAAPLPPRKPTEVELQREIDRDHQARQMMTLSFVAYMQDVAKRHRRVVASVREDAMQLAEFLAQEAASAVLPDAGDALSVVPEEAVVGNGSGSLPAPMDILNELEPESIQPAFSLPNTQELDSLSELGDGAPAPLATAEPTLEPNSTSAEAPKTWQAHDVDLDTIQRKLLKHKYYTPDDVLADVHKIELNAERLDGDRQAKVADFAANVRMHVANFDQRWIPEFARYSERMKHRKAEKQRARVAAATTGVDIGVGDTAPATSAEQLVSEPTARSLDGDVTMTMTPEELSASLKRPRESEDSTDQPSEKRAREDVAEARESSPPEARPPVSEVTVPPPQSPKTVYPPFRVPVKELDLLESELTGELTASLNVEQLDQIRAMLFDRVWRHRAEWDRTDLVKTCRDVLRNFREDVADSTEDLADTSSSGKAPYQ